jgi:DNA-3-methyladenine glycosylase II
MPFNINEDHNGPFQTSHSDLPANSWEDQEREIHLKVPVEFDYDENLKYLANAPNECTFYIRGDRIYKALSLGNETPVIEITGNKNNKLIIRFLGDTNSSDKCVRVDVANYVRDWFDLNTDLVPFYELAKTDFLIKQAVYSFYGLRNVGVPNLFEAYGWGIMGQQVNMTLAYTVKRRLVENFGRSLECEGEQYWIFPTPEVIANLKVRT